VYSLGATLYALVTGQAPVAGADVPEILGKVQAGDVPPPRHVNRGVDAALEAICRKAMALKPEDRYASPRHLANDVENWLADEPVIAYRERWRERAGRWIRRHRTKVMTAVAALAVAVITLTMATVLLTAANKRERAARNRTRERLMLAREAVDKFYTQVKESPEMKDPGVETLRAKLLEVASEFYELLQQFIQEAEGTEPNARAERARAFERLADLNHAIGGEAEAEKGNDPAIKIWKVLAGHHPEKPVEQYGLAESQNRLGLLYGDTGRRAVQEKANQNALIIRKKPAADHPALTEYQRHLAWSYHNLGDLYNKMGRQPAALQVLQESLALAKALTTAQPDVPDYTVLLGATYVGLGNVEPDTGQSAAGLK
jgi:tetratricopeptide (TPR) repeat protein